MIQVKVRKWSLKKRLLAGFMSLMVAVSLVLSGLFLHTGIKMQNEYKKLVRNSVEGVVDSIDSLVGEVYTVSDAFASNPQLDSYIDREYYEGESIIKKADTIKLFNQIISSYDLLQKRQQLKAIYTSKGVLYNFNDVNKDGKEVMERLDELGVNDPQNLMRFSWYPLQENFMTSQKKGNAREDKVIIGSRRVYSVWKASYVCTHIFCIQEKELYQAYKESVVETKGDIYILDEKGRLLSSSNEQSVEDGKLNTELKELVSNRSEDEFIWKNNGEKMHICVRQSDLNKWLSVSVISEKSINGEISVLYIRIFLILLTCMLVCCGLFLYLHQSFITPINELNAAMTEVYSGNLNAYVKENGRYEAVNMIRYFNTMLKSINVHVVEKLEAERKKKELELDVLMSQINPHFLYNTLETIVWKSNEAGYPDIGRLAASLGRMYRLSISSGNIIVPMQQEIEHLMAYIKIQKNRYGSSFEFDLRTDASQIKRLYILKISLQPILENSFLYGMEGLERKMLIRLKMKEKDDHVEIRILDNGMGMNQIALERVRKQIAEGTDRTEHDTSRRGTGIGLHNVAERMKLYFGVENPLRIYSKQGIGTITIISIPILTAEDVMKNEEWKGLIK